jgi:hypothetical protein
MIANRTPLNRQRTPTITAEMTDLYARGIKLRRMRSEAAHDEFVQVSKRLNWTLLRREPHEVSIFDDLSGEMPAYMQARCSLAHPDFNGWLSGRELQKRLKAALATLRGSASVVRD